MELAVDAKKGAERYIGALRAFRRRHRGLRGVFLIQDGDPSHTAADTAAYWSDCRGWWRPRFTPAHASWLDQAELLIGAFGHRYLKRASWHSRTEFVEHLTVSWLEYNPGRTHQTSSILLAPATTSPRNTGSRAAVLRLRAMLSFRGCCLSRPSANLRISARFAAP